MSAKLSSASEKPAACIDDSPSPSVGLAAAKLLDIEPEKERWWGSCRDTGLSQEFGDFHAGYRQAPPSSRLTEPQEGWRGASELFITLSRGVSYYILCILNSIYIYVLLA